MQLRIIKNDISLQNHYFPTQDFFKFLDFSKVTMGQKDGLVNKGTCHQV